jgi:hypothetical protein
MERGDDSISHQSHKPEEPGFISHEQSNQSSSIVQRGRLAKFVLQKLNFLSKNRGHKSDEECRGTRVETTDYTLDRFAVEQFERARAEFRAWYDVAQNPDTATEHPLVVARFADTLDPEDAAEIFEWWVEEGERLMDALDESGQRLNEYRGQYVPDGDDVAQLLEIASNTESCVENLLECLEQSRLEEA